MESIENKVNNNCEEIKSISEKQKEINTSVEILKDRNKSDWEKAVEKYEKEKATREAKKSKDLSALYYKDEGNINRYLLID